jgi:hypothetical protein
VQPGQPVRVATNAAPAGPADTTRSASTPDSSEVDAL